MLNTPPPSSQISLCKRYLASLRTFWAPFTNAHYLCYANDIVSYDSHMIRHTETKDVKYTLKEHFRSPESSILLGSSAAMGCFSTSNSTTLASRLANLFRKPVFNLGVPGTTILQNVLALDGLYRKYYRANGTGPKKIIFYGFYNELSVLCSERNHFYIPALDYVNYDLRVPLHLAGSPSKFTSYISNTPGLGPATISDIMPSFLRTQQEYGKAMIDMDMFQFDDNISIFRRTLEELALTRLLANYSANDSARAAFLIDCVKQSNSIDMSNFNHDVISETLAKLDSILNPALSILAALAKEFSLELYFFAQPNMYSASTNLSRVSRNINSESLTVANQVLRRTPFQNLSNQAFVTSMVNILFDPLIDHLKSLTSQKCHGSQFYNLNIDPIVLRNSSDLVSKPFYCDEVHLTDFGFDTVAHAIASQV